MTSLVQNKERIRIAGESSHVKNDPKLKCKEIIKKISKVVLAILEILRSIFVLPFVGIDVILHKSSLRFMNFRKKPVIEVTDNNSKLIKIKSLHLVEDSLDAYEWKKKLVEGAKHSLEIAGYCGGKPFKDFLEIIERKLKENDKFKVRILSNYNHINPEERIIYKRLEKKYPNSFQIVVTKAVWGIFPKLMRHENHTKLVMADEHTFITGGSGITNHLLPKEAITRKQAFDFLADGNRDLDLLVQGEEASQALKSHFDRVWKKWKILTGKPKINSLDKGADLEGNTERVQIKFPEEKLKSLSCKLIFSHPEEKVNSNLHAYIRAISKAKKTIDISNMVFNESKIANALKKAIKRGVNVNVITNSDDSRASFAGNTLGPRNRTRYKKLFNDSKSCSKNSSSGEFKVHEYIENKILLHSKAMVVDKRAVFIGSFNISKESVHCDDEQVMIIKSSKLARKVLKRFNIFKKHSKEISLESTRRCSFKMSVLKGQILNTILRDILN